MEETEALKLKYEIQCKKCGHKFFPWKCLIATLPRNNMQPYVYCPQCGNYDNIEEFKIN